MRKLTSMILSVFALVLFCGTAMAAPVTTNDETASAAVKLQIGKWQEITLDVDEVMLKLGDADGEGLADATGTLGFGIKTNYAGTYTVAFVGSDPKFNDGTWTSEVTQNGPGTVTAEAPVDGATATLTVKGIDHKASGYETAQQIGTLTVTVTEDEA